MFGTLLNRFSPLATVYNSLVIVKSAFEQFEIKHYAYDAIQTEQVQETFEYNPYAGIDQDHFITNDTENDFMIVDKLMEDADDDDYCHLAIETQAGNTTTSIPSVDNASSHSSAAAPLVNGAYNLASVLVGNLANSFICVTVLSCNFVWTGRKSLEDFVQEKSEKIANAPIVRSVSAPAQTKMRGFATDFGADVPGIKFNIPKSAANHHSHPVATKHYANDKKPKKIADVTANIRVTHKLFGITPPSRRIARCNQVSFNDKDDWGLVEKDYTVGSNANCNL